MGSSMSDPLTIVDLIYWMALAAMAWRIDYLSSALRLEREAVAEFEAIAERIATEVVLEEAGRP